MWKYIVTWTVVSWLLIAPTVEDEYGRGTYKDLVWKKQEVLYSKEFIDKIKAVKFIEDAPLDWEKVGYELNDKYCEDMKLDSVFLKVAK